MKHSTTYRSQYNRPEPYAMDFEITDEQCAVRAVGREFAREVVEPTAPENDRNHDFRLRLFARSEISDCSDTFSEKHGGAGGDFLSYCIEVEEISRADAGVGITLEAAASLGAGPIHVFGTEEQKKGHLPGPAKTSVVRRSLISGNSRRSRHLHPIRATWHSPRGPCRSGL